MTLAELEKSLPNGLHDAELVGIQLDYSAQKAVLNVNIDVVDPDEGASRDVPYKAAQVLFFGVQFVAIDAPAGEDSYSRVSTIDTGSGQPSTAPCTLPPICKDCFLCWIFVTEWNSFIRISARSVALEWADGF
jgi:hypothetical protein